MTTGRISKIVTSYGSRWGRVRAYGDSHELFFSPRSLDRPEEFDEMKLGQEVKFDEEPDRANTTHAVHLVLTSGAASGDAGIGQEG